MDAHARRAVGALPREGRRETRVDTLDPVPGHHAPQEPNKPGDRLPWVRHGKQLQANCAREGAEGSGVRGLRFVPPVAVANRTLGQVDGVDAR